MRHLLGRPDPHRLELDALRFNVCRAGFERRQFLEGLAVRGDFEDASVERVASLGLAGGDGDGTEDDRLIEDEREMIVLAGVLGRREVAVGVAVEGELANLWAGGFQRRFDDGGHARRLGVECSDRQVQDQSHGEEESSHGSLRWVILVKS